MDTAVKSAHRVHGPKVIAAIVAVLALATGCGSSRSNSTPANRAPVAVNPGVQTGVVGEPSNLRIARGTSATCREFSACSRFWMSLERNVAAITH